VIEQNPGDRCLMACNKRENRDGCMIGASFRWLIDKKKKIEIVSCMRADVAGNRSRYYGSEKEVDDRRERAKKG